MEKFDRKKHWDNIYKTKELKDVSWFQPSPETSLNFFKRFNVQANAKVIDIGGGDSLLVDHKTPFDTIQQFVFCSFRKLQAT